MLRPTLFIGLGTTGTKILMKLRELMSEEYERAGLPIFRYISIETDGKFEVDNTLQMEDYEKINLIKATIDNFDNIRIKIDPNDKPNYSPQWASWLNPDLLNYAVNFTSGAGNIRMAGRMCLWENWEKMRDTILKDYAAIIAPATIKEANQLLSQHLKNKGLPGDGSLAGGENQIYLVGSLCGGTCSGMMIDMAYFCRNLFEGQDGSEVHGTFTMHDQDIAANAEAITAVHAANCYGGLWELNYYNHPKKNYDVIFPDGRKAREPEKNPFDNTMLVSRSSVNPIYKFVDEDGNFDEDGLNLMVAMHLFAETAGDTIGLKNAIGIDGKALPSYGKLKLGPDNKNTVMSRSLASFGLTAVWYPKYRIASASAALVNQRLCEKWNKANSPEINIVNDAKKVWDDILSKNIIILASPDGLTPLKGQIDDLLDKAASKFESAKADTLRNDMRNYPDDESFKRKFESGGEYYKLLAMQAPICQQNFQNSIEDSLKVQFEKIDLEGSYGLGDVNLFFKNLDEEIEKTLGDCPTLPPTLDLNRLNFDAMVRSESNRWTKLLGLHDKSVEAHRQELIEQYRRLICEGSGSIYVSLRNYFLRSILQNIRKGLGYGDLPTDNDGQDSRQTIRQRLEQINTSLTGCADSFEDNYKEAVELPRAECVMIVTNNDDNELDIEAEDLSRRIVNSTNLVSLRNGEMMASFLEKDQDAIVKGMTEHFRRIALSQIRGHDVIKEVQKHLDSGSPEIPNLSKRSNPYQSFISTYQSLIPNPPKIIFGHDQTGSILDDLQGTLKFTDNGNSSVDHLLFFYQETFGYAMDDLEVFQTLKRQFDKTPPPGAFGHLTHHNPDFYNLQFEDKSNKLTHWCRVLAVLVPEILKTISSQAFSGVFRLDYGRYVFEYPVDGLPRTLGLNDDADGIKLLARMEHSTVYDKFIRDVQAEFALFGRERIASEIIDPLLHKVENLTTRNKLSIYYNNFLDEVYSDYEITDKTDTDTDIDEYFSQIYSQPTPQSEETPTPPNQEEGSKSEAQQPSVETDDFGATVEDEDVSETENINQVHVEPPQDTSSQDEVTGETDDGFVSSKVETKTQPNPPEEATVDQQSSPETDEPEQKHQPDKDFSSADKEEPPPRRKRTPK